MYELELAWEVHISFLMSSGVMEVRRLFLVLSPFSQDSIIVTGAEQRRMPMRI